MVEGHRSRSPRDRAEVLPRRVRVALAVELARSERLIGWIQLAVVLAFGILYAVAPGAAPASAPFNPVLWVLLGYFVFTCLRLVLAYRYWLPRWFLCLSPIADVLILMALIWSFHVQHDQPPAIYLEAPTWGYVFIFIALRALSFEPRYVLIAGTTAMIGWAFLVGYALHTGPGLRLIHDDVTYGTTPAVLLGAELDKLITIAVVTAILALGLDRGRRILIRAATEAEAARELARFFTPEIAQQITSAEQPLRPGHGQRRQAAVLYVDIKGFTCLAAGLTPDEAIGLLTEYQARLVPIIRRHGGSVDKFMGDGIMATFGTAGESRTFAADALRAVEDLVAEVRAWTASRTGAAAPDAAVENQARAVASAGGVVPCLGSATFPCPRASWPPAALQVSIAVAHGPLVVGAVGDADRLEYTVVGHPVNLAAKLEKHTRLAGATALTTGETFRAALDQGYVVRADAGCEPYASPIPQPIAGVDQPVELVVLAP